MMIPILVLAILLSACGASGQSTAVSTPSNTSSQAASTLLDELEDETKGATSGVAQSTNEEVVCFKHIGICNSNGIIFTLLEENGLRKGVTVRTFDGENIEQEAIRRGTVMVVAYATVGLDTYHILSLVVNHPPVC